MDQTEGERRRRVALAVANQELEGLVVSQETLGISGGRSWAKPRQKRPLRGKRLVEWAGW